MNQPNNEKKTMRKQALIGFILLALAALVLGACGGGDDTGGGEPSGPSDNQPAETAGPTSQFPPTWTPAPTRTEPPRVTYAYTYEAPTSIPLPTGNFPTRPAADTPAPNATLGPNATLSPSGGGLVVTAERLNEVVGRQLGTIAGSLFPEPPQITIQDGLIRATLTVYTTPSNPDTARPVQMDMSAAIEAGRVRLAPQAFVFTDDGTAYGDALAGSIQLTIETAINDQVNQQYLTLYPDGAAITMTSVTITDAGVSVEIAPVEE
jgi:hypothetical protein